MFVFFFFFFSAQARQCSGRKCQVVVAKGAGNEANEEYFAEGGGASGADHRPLAQGP